MVLVLATPLLIHPLINSRPVKTRLAQEIKKYSGIDLQPEATEFFLAPVPGVRFLDTDIEFSDQFQLSVKSTEILIDMSQLVQGKLAVSRIEIQGPKLVYRPSESQVSKPEVSDQPSFHFRMPVEAVDELFSLFPDSQEDLEILVKQAQTDYFSSMDARFMVFRDNRSLAFKTRIKGIDLSHGQIPEFDTATSDLIKFVNAEDLSLELSLNGDNVLDGRFSLAEPKVGTYDLPDSPLHSKGLNLDFTVSKDAVRATLAPADLIYPKGKVGVTFRHQPTEKRTTLTFTGSDIDIGTAREVCLPLLGHEDVVDTLFDILRGGKAEEIEVKFDAPSLAELFDGQNLHLAGNAGSATVKIPEVPLLVENVSGSATMDNGVLHVKARQGIVRSTSIKGGVLDLDLVNHKDIGFKGKFNLRADLSVLPKTLQDLLPETTLARELKDIRKIEGNADAVLELGMPPETQDLTVRVHATGISAKADYAPVPLPLSVSAGEFFYDADLIRIKGVAGTIGTSPVEFSQANINLGPSSEMNLEGGAGTLTIEEFMPWLRDTPAIMDTISPARQLKGRLDIAKLDIQGPMFSPAQWKFKVRGTASGIDIGFDDNKPADIAGLSCNFTGSQTGLDISGMNAGILDVSWLSDAVDPDYLSSIQMPLLLVDTAIKEQKGKDFFHGRIKAPGGPEIAVDLTGESISDLVPTLVMVKDGAITDVLIMPNPNPDKPMISFEGKLNTLTLEKLLVKDSVLHQKLTALTAGDPITCYTDSNSQIHLNASRINLDILLSEQQASDKTPSGGVAQNGRPLLAQKSMSVTTDQLVYLQREFEDVEANVYFDPEQTQININSAVLCGLSTHGRLTMPHMSDSRDMDTQLAISSTGKKDISTSLACLFGTESLIEGGYAFEADIAGKGPAQNIADRQNGTMSFKSSDGRIYKATLLSRVLSVLNILGDTDLKQQGFGYKTITVKADVKNSVIHLTKAYVDADNMAIIASGWIAPMEDRLDVTFLVAPLKTIDTIIQHIPLVNTILSGRLVSFPAKASGKISDPTVTPLHPSAVGKGLINLFGDLLKAPVRLIQGDPNNDE